MNKLTKIISELSYDELKLIKKDLSEGNMEKLINLRLKNFEEERVGTVCPICNAQISDPDNGAFTLIFGPKDFRRKATFDGADCMEYFIEHLKKISSKKIRKDGEENGAFGDYKDI
jgi:hypothetical protein